MQVFIANIAGREVLNAKASALGLKAGDLHLGGYKNLPAISGNTFAVKDVLKAHGARWNGVAKVWTFETLQALEAALDAVAA